MLRSKMERSDFDGLPLGVENRHLYSHNTSNVEVGFEFRGHHRTVTKLYSLPDVKYAYPWLQTVARFLASEAGRMSYGGRHDLWASTRERLQEMISRRLMEDTDSDLAAISNRNFLHLDAWRSEEWLRHVARPEILYVYGFSDWPHWDARSMTFVGDNGRRFDVMAAYELPNVPMDAMGQP